MPRQRAPLQALDLNVAANHDIPAGTKGFIYGQASSGKLNKEIAEETGLKPSIISKVLKRINNDKSLEIKPRSGRPPKYSIQTKRVVVRLVRSKPNITYKGINADLQRALGRKVSIPTIRGWLNECGIAGWRMKHRPYIDDVRAKDRFEWARKHLDWTVDQWSNVMFTDECSYERGKGTRPTYVFRTSTQKWDSAMVQSRPSGRQLSQMVWGAIWDGQHSDLVPLDRDFESKKQGYSSRSYIKVLDENLLRYYTPDLLFQQDNAPIHKSRATMKWLAEKHIISIEWPPYSPDMNPIEDMWALLKQKVIEMFPELVQETSRSEESRQRLLECLKAAWLAIDSHTILSLIESMPRRVQALYDARGWHTKY